MSQWVEGFEGHGIHTLLAGLMERTNELLEQMQDENLDRILQVLTVLRFHLQNCDPELVSFTILQDLNNQLSHINSYYDNYIAQGNLAYMTNVGSTANDIIAKMNQLNVPKAPTDIEGIKEAIVSFRRSLGQNRRTLNEEIDAFNKELESLRQVKKEIESTVEEISATLEADKEYIDSRTDEVKLAIENHLGTYQSQLSTFTDEVKMVIENHLGTYQRELSTLLAGFERTFQTYEDRYKQKEDDWTDRFKERIIELDKKTDDTVQGFTRRFYDQEASLSAQVDEIGHEMESAATLHLTEIKRLNEDAIKLINAMGYMATGSGYQETAKEARKTKNLWRLIASLSMIAAAVYSIVYAFTFDHTSSWPMLTAKLLPALAVGSFAAYASRLAALAYQEERYNRKMALELAAIGPYLSEIDPEKAREIKGRLADRFFANDLTLQQKESQDQTKDSSGINAQEIITKLLELIVPNKK